MAKPGQQTGDAVGTARDRSLIIVGQKEKNLIRKIASWITRLGWIPLVVSFCAYHWGGGLGAGYSLYAAGGKKDKRLRLHPDLVPYDELPKKEQDKDDFYDPTIRDMVDAMLPEKKS